MKRYRIEVTIPVIVTAPNEDKARGLAAESVEAGYTKHAFIYDDAVEEVIAHRHDRACSGPGSGVDGKCTDGYSSL